MDVTDRGQIDAAIGRIVETYGRLDILVNNAGINTMKHRVTIDEFPREEWDRILAVDLTGLFEVSQAAARVMREQQVGPHYQYRVPSSAWFPCGCNARIAAAKAGVVNLTKAMALELGPHGILVNAIAPGSILTEGTKQLFYGADGMFSDSVQKMLDHVPLGRPGTTDEIAVAVLFLADPENAYTHGHILTVDGGWTVGYAREF